MKFLNSKPAVIVAGVLAAGAVLYFFARQTSSKVSDAADGVGRAINPLNNDNIFASGANAVGAELTGDSGFSIGGAIFDFFNPELAAYDPNAPTSDNDSLVSILPFSDDAPIKTRRPYEPLRF